MFTFIMILVAILAVLITLVVLLQSGKGGGLAGIAAGSATTQILGARQAPDVLEKMTWIFASLFIVLCVVSNFAIDRGSVQESEIQRRAQQEQSQQAPVLPPGSESSTPQGSQPATPQQTPPAGTPQTPPGNE